MEKDISILIFGTSITLGYWDRQGGWVTRLRNFFYEKYKQDPEYYCAIYNVGISGNTTEHILERFNFETKQRISEKAKEIIIIFDFGTNDAVFSQTENKLRVPEEKFKENSKKLINLAKQYSSKIFLIGNHPVDEKITDPVPWNKDVSYKNKDAEKYNEIMKLVCQEENILFIDFFNILNVKTDLEDGVHPNSEGHEKIFKKIKEELLKNNII